jgi:hypothetical protein
MTRAGLCWVGLSVALASLLALVACQRGSGSDIGPDLRPLPDGTFRVLVRNNQGEAVTAAVVSVASVTPTAATGHTGRSVINAQISGTQLITIDGTNASATDNAVAEDDDELGTIAISALIADGLELPFTVFLPDVSDSAGLAVTTGTQGAPSTLNDAAASSGAVLTISAGDTVTFGVASSVTLKTGPLADVHLPGTIPGFPPGQVFTGRGVFISPADVQFTIGAALSLPNDLNLAASASADLYHLDPTTGSWTRVGSGTEAGGRIVAPSGSVQSGGLYCFVTTSSASTIVSGTVVDRRSIALPGVLVRGPQAWTRTDGAGQYTLPAMARLDASGSNRTVTVEFDGWTWTPRQKQSTRHSTRFGSGMYAC